MNHPAARLRFQGSDRLLYPGHDVRMGRAAENDMVINDPKVSRIHAALEWNGSGFSLRDLGSINGTYVNGERLSSMARLLRDGDQINLSKFDMTYEIIRIEAPAPVTSIPALAATEPLAPAGPSLIVVDGPDLGQVYPLWGEQITIGRSSREATWEIRLTDRAVSRPHARIERSESGFTLIDLNSANGTLLNDKPVTGPVPLNDGDVISAGESRLVFQK